MHSVMKGMAKLSYKNSVFFLGTIQLKNILKNIVKLKIVVLDTETQ